MTEKQKEQAACTTYQELVDLFVGQGLELYKARYRANKVWEYRQKKQYTQPAKPRPYHSIYND